MNTLFKIVSLSALNLLLIGLLTGPSSAKAGWAPISPAAEPDTSLAANNVDLHRQLSLPYNSRSRGISGVFYADVRTSGSAFDIEMIDFSDDGEDCEIHVFGDAGYYEQWNTETCDPNHIFIVLSLVFEEQIEDSILDQWWQSNGSSFGVGGGGGGNENPVFDPSQGRQDGGDSETSECMGAIALNCGLTFVGGLAAVATASAVLTPAGGAAVAVIAGASVGVACGASIYNECIDNYVQLFLDLVEVDTTVGVEQELVVDVDALIDYLESLLGGGVVVEGIDPSDLLSEGTGFVVTLSQPGNVQGLRTLGGVPLDLFR